MSVKGWWRICPTVDGEIFETAEEELEESATGDGERGGAPRKPRPERPPDPGDEASVTDIMHI